MHIDPTLRTSIEPKGTEHAAPAAAKDELGDLVLVVDDEEIIRSVAEQILEVGGYRVLSAEDGQEGIRLFHEHAGDIKAVLLDITMPRMSGEETLVHLKSIREDACIILTSGFNERDATRQFAGRGFSAFLQKPFRARALLDMVQATITDSA